MSRYCCITAGEHYDVLNKKTHLVARAGFDGDLEISDMSVSRRHADIVLVKKVCTSSLSLDGRRPFYFNFFFNFQAVSGTVKLLLKVVDRRSKFGTFVNSGIDLNERIESDCPMVLELNDRIRFGIMDSVWTCVIRQFVRIGEQSTFFFIAEWWNILLLFVHRH